MSKIRVYELARDLKIETKLLMNTLKTIGIVLPSHQSMLTDEQVVQLRKAISGEGVKEASSSASAPVKRAAADGGVRVIRRRRGGAEPEESASSATAEQSAEAAAASDSSTSADTPTTNAAASSSSSAEVSDAPSKVSDSAPSSSAQTESSEATSRPSSTDLTGTVSESAAMSASAKDESSTSATAASNTGSSAASPAAKHPSEAAATRPSLTQQTGPRSFTTNRGPQSSDTNRSFSTNSQSGSSPRADESRRRPSSGGATIVRRATPEEMQAQANRASQQQYSSSYSGRRGGGPGGQGSYGGGSVRREDSRGTKYTGFGLPPQGEPSIDISALEDGTNKALRRARDKRKETDDADEQAILAKKASVKPGSALSKRASGVNLKQLLNEIQDFDGDVDDATADLMSAKTKTVYTPRGGHRRKDLKRRKDLRKTEVTVARQAYRTIVMGATITVADLAHQLKVKAADIIKKLMDQGMMVSANQSIDFDTAAIIAGDFEYEIKSNVKSMADILGVAPRAEGEAVGDEERPPIVTVMGHVDHGKTSILDTIRKSRVAAGEAGGITQHIGAYSVQHDGKQITFLDTPGHEAFSSMRARGANLTDIVVLVVAADDGVMPQTVEAISHAKAAGVPVIVAVNKIDKETANVDRIYRELSEKEVIAEEWGGDTQFVKVSAVTREGIDDLLQAILLQAEVLELRTNSKIPATGVVVEAHLDQGRGPIATILVKDGTLNNGDYLVVGTTFGRIRAMNDHHGKRVTAAGPAIPVAVLGLSAVPQAGEQAFVVKDEKKAREAIDWVQENQKTAQEKANIQSLEDLMGKMKEAGTPELAVILKADTQGSLEAIADSLTKLNSDRVRTRIVHKAVGGISESDISLAEASGAVVIGFNVRAARGLDDAAPKRGVLIKYFSIIYDLVDTVKGLMAGKLPPIIEEVIIGHAEVRQPIQVPKIGVIAGSSVIDGRISRTSGLRLIRNDIVIYTGKISSLRRFKDDVKEVKTGFECGIGIENYNDIHVGDVIEAFEIKETRATL